MVSNSGRRSGSSGRSSSRNRVVIGAEETTRVRYTHGKPEVEAERKKKPRPSSKPARRASQPQRKTVSAGRKVASQKRDERDQRRRDASRRRTLLIALAVAVVAAAVWGLVALWNAPLFPVTKVAVSGASHLSRSDVLQLAAVPPDATLLRLPKQEIVTRLESSPWVADVQVSRTFPDTLDIAVKERTPVAIADAGAAGGWVVSGDGVWLAKKGSEPTGTLLPIRDVANLQPAVGKRVTSPELKNALTIVTGMSGQLRGMAKYVSAASIEKTMIVLKNDVQVFVGPADDIQKKDLIARGILKSKKGVVYVNVRVIDRPTWRGLTPAE